MTNMKLVILTLYKFILDQDFWLCIRKWIHSIKLAFLLLTEDVINSLYDYRYFYSNNSYFERLNIQFKF